MGKPKMRNISKTSDRRERDGFGTQCYSAYMQGTFDA